MSNYRINIENIYPSLKITKRQVINIAQLVLSSENILAAEINIVFVDDPFIIRLNQQFLNIGTTTDVLSFNLTEEYQSHLEGEVYANVEQVRRQAVDYQVSFEQELFRIIIHGLLHLIGFDDRTGKEKETMTEKENYYLERISLN